MKSDETLDPVDAGLFCTQAITASAQGVAHLVQEFGRKADLGPGLEGFEGVSWLFSSCTGMFR